MPIPVIDRLLRRTSGQDDPAGCWLWQGRIGPTGYGTLRASHLPADGMAYVHRVAYEHFIGPVPPGLQIDHLCHGEALAAGTCAPGPCVHRRCVNPAHLEAVTRTANLYRGDTITAANAAATHCPQGHPYSGSNLIIETSTGARRCRTCRNKPRVGVKGDQVPDRRV